MEQRQSNKEIIFFPQQMFLEQLDIHSLKKNNLDTALDTDLYTLHKN